MLILALGLVLFLGTHSVSIISRPWRDARAAALGDSSWRGLYALLSLIGLGLIVWGYMLARPDAAILYTPPLWTRHLAGLLMLFSMLCLAVSILPAGRLKPAMKHPLLAAVKIWSFAHLIANGDAASVLLFGAFLAWAVVDRISLQRRGAPIAAPGPWSRDIAALALGLVLYGLIVWVLHEPLFGVAPFG